MVWNRRISDSNFFFSILLPFALICVTLVIGSITIPISTRDAIVVSHEWERTQELEEYQTLQREGWDYPFDARIQRREWRFSHNRQIVVGTERYVCGKSDNVNTYCTRNVYRDDAVYDWYYHYEIDRWVVVRISKKTATGINPLWPTDLVPNGDKQRLGSRTERYWLNVKIDGEVHEVDLIQAKWKEISDGRKIQVRVNFWGSPLNVVEDLKKSEQLAVSY